MAFKMKRPMIMGTPMHKQAVSSALKKETIMVYGQSEERKGGERPDNPKLSPYEVAKKRDPKLDSYIATRKDPNASDLEKAKAQDAINAAYGRGPTDRAEKLKAKQDAQPKKEEPKKDSSKPAEKADTSKGTNMDKIAKGEKPEGSQKATGSSQRMKPGDEGYNKLPESEKRKIHKAATARHKKALEAWRAGGRKGKRPQRRNFF